MSSVAESLSHVGGGCNLGPSKVWRTQNTRLNGGSKKKTKYHVYKYIVTTYWYDIIGETNIVLKLIPSIFIAFNICRKRWHYKIRDFVAHIIFLLDRSWSTVSLLRHFTMSCLLDFLSELSQIQVLRGKGILATGQLNARGRASGMLAVYLLKIRSSYLKINHKSFFSQSMKQK